MPRRVSGRSRVYALVGYRARVLRRQQWGATTSSQTPRVRTGRAVARGMGNVVAALEFPVPVRRLFAARW